MASPFDSAWALPDAALADEMGEAVFIGGVEVTAVVSEVEAGRFKAGPVVSAGVDYQVHLSRAQITALVVGRVERGALALEGQRVRRAANGVEGVVLLVQDLGGAGALLGVGSPPRR